MGTFGLLAYSERWSLPEEIHEFAYALYSFKTITGVFIGLLVVPDPSIAFTLGAFVALPIWWVGVEYFGNDVPFSEE